MSCRAPVLMVRGDAFADLPGFVEDIGLHPGILADSAALTLSLLGGRPRHVPLRGLGSLLDAASRASGDAALGLHFAQFTGMRPLLEMKALLSGQPTLSALIRASSRLIGFHTQGAVMTCEERGAQVLWTYRLDESVRAGRCHGNQLALSMMMALLRAALGRRWLPDAVLIEQERPVRVDAFEEMLGPRLAFDMPLSGILFPKRLLAHPLPRVGPDGFGEVACLQEAFLDAAPGADLVAAVRQLIAASLGDGGPRIGQIADACGLSARTLQRQLSAGGAGFSGLVDAVRRAEAEVRLRTTDEPLLSIALDLGYSDASNFTHAFRRWAGITPSAYRRGCAVPKSTA